MRPPSPPSLLPRRHRKRRGQRARSPRQRPYPLSVFLEQPCLVDYSACASMHCEIHSGKARWSHSVARERPPNSEGLASMSRLRSRLTYANVMATVAVFIALGGSATAAVLITGKNVKDGTLTGKDIKNSSIGSVDVKDGTLLPKDFRGARLPAGPKGDTGTVDTSNFYDKGASDARFLGLGAKAADSSLLGGKASSAF